jgi:hypothetical protein
MSKIKLSFAIRMLKQPSFWRLVQDTYRNNMKQPPIVNNFVEVFAQRWTAVSGKI